MINEYIDFGAQRYFLLAKHELNNKRLEFGESRSGSAGMHKKPTTRSANRSNKSELLIRGAFSLLRYLNYPSSKT